MTWPAVPACSPPLPLTRQTNYEEKHNKAAFVKNIISDNILPGDVYVRAKELHFVTDVPRAVLLVRQYDHPEIVSVEVIQNLFPDKQHDFVLSVSETDIVVIKEVATPDEPEEVQSIAQNIEKTLHDQLQVKCVVGISTTARHLRELADRYKEAQVAIDVGRVFDTEKDIISYENLGLGRIIYQLPTTLCEMFLQEVFKKNPIESLDEDTLETINKFLKITSMYPRHRESCMFTATRWCIGLKRLKAHRPRPAGV